MHDAPASGGRLRVPTVVDVFTRECPALEVRRDCRRVDVAEVLDGLRVRRGGRGGPRHASAGSRSALRCGVPRPSPEASPDAGARRARIGTLAGTGRHTRRPVPGSPA